MAIALTLTSQHHAGLGYGLSCRQQGERRDDFMSVGIEQLWIAVVYAYYKSTSCGQTGQKVQTVWQTGFGKPTLQADPISDHHFPKYKQHCIPLGMETRHDFLVGWSIDREYHAYSSSITLQTATKTSRFIICILLERWTAILEKDGASFQLRIIMKITSPFRIYNIQ